MDSSLKNIALVLLLLTFVVIGYYIYAQKDTMELSFAGINTDELFADVQKYSDRRQLLDAAKIGSELFSDPYFRSLESYASPVPEQPIGRGNPFDKPVSSVE